MRRSILLALAVTIALGGTLTGLFVSGAFSQDESIQTQIARQTQGAVLTMEEATADAVTPPPKEPITIPVITSCPDQNALHQKAGIFAVDPNRGSPNPLLGVQVNEAATFASDGLVYDIIGGAVKGEPSQGAIEVWAITTDPCAAAAGLVPRHQPQVYQTPFKDGAVTLTNVTGDTLDFRTADGTTGSLDYLTGTFH